MGSDEKAGLHEKAALPKTSRWQCGYLCVDLPRTPGSGT